MAAKRRPTDGASTTTSRKRAIDIPQHPQPEGYRTAAVYVPIDELRRWAGNPRDNAASVRKAMRSIRRHGFGAPLLARLDTRELIAGDTRILASMQLRKRGVGGLDELPVRFMALDELKAHSLAIADNRVGEESEWDDEKRAAIVRELDEADEDLAATGLDEDEIEEALFGDEEGLDLGGDDDEGQRRVSDGLTYTIVVTCTDEDQQAALLEKLGAEGYDAKPVIT